MYDTSSLNASAERISVVLSATVKREYDIVVRPNLLQTLGEECSHVLPANARILVLTDTHLAERYLPTVTQALQAGGFEVIPCVIPAGENSKTLSTAQQVYELALNSGLTRKDAILGLGGGVVGDLSGYCASTYHRGMALIHVPTSLVAQVDSAIGGKTAVNFERVKNIVGTFYQPLAVLSDTETLITLPPRELAAGMAEVIKYGLIETSCLGNKTNEHGFFDWLLHHTQAGTLQANFPEMIRRCAAIKAAVVMQDELETKGMRFFLNLGHTFGHAYESLSAYKLLHGEAVAIGMVKAVRLAIRLGMVQPALETQLLSLYEPWQLPAEPPADMHFEPEALLQKMRQDKKNRDANIRLILPTGETGQVVVRDDISEAQILACLSE
jgi:3-dehydroquinate synthase